MLKGQTELAACKGLVAAGQLVCGSGAGGSSIHILLLSGVCSGAM